MNYSDEAEAGGDEVSISLMKLNQVTIRCRLGRLLQNTELSTSLLGENLLEVENIKVLDQEKHFKTTIH